MPDFHTSPIVLKEYLLLICSPFKQSEAAHHVLKSLLKKAKTRA